MCQHALLIITYPCNFFLPVLHTSASLALNESWDPDVRDDMEMMLNKLVPEVSSRHHDPKCSGLFKNNFISLLGTNE